MPDYEAPRRTIAADSLRQFRANRRSRRAFVRTALRIDPASPEARSLSLRECRESRLVRQSVHAFLNRGQLPIH